jgi:hypothetical protein
VAKIFYKLNQISNLKSQNNDLTSSGAHLTKIQSYILKYSISLLPILIKSKRYPMQRISEFYIGFLQSRFALQTQFLSKFIKTPLFENQGK